LPWRWDFSLFASLMQRGAAGSNQRIFMDTIIVGFLSLALLIYLIIAMLWPEKF
jgi:K+-transporting ATPase KdpF subunit